MITNKLTYTNTTLHASLVAQQQLYLQSTGTTRNKNTTNNNKSNITNDTATSTTSTSLLHSIIYNNNPQLINMPYLQQQIYTNIVLDDSNNQNMYTTIPNNITNQSNKDNVNANTSTNTVDNMFNNTSISTRHSDVTVNNILISIFIIREPQMVLYRVMWNVPKTGTRQYFY